jgi:hypothetical protein
MSGAKSKNKGASFERDVVKILSAFYYPEGDGCFRRVPLSGGWDSRVAPGDVIALKKNNAQLDAYVIDPSWPFVVECKNWKSTTISHFPTGFYGAESSFFQWMAQCVEAADASGKTPIVVFKIFKYLLVIIRTVDFSRLQELFGEFDKKRYRLERIDDNTSVKLEFMMLTDFLKWIDFYIFKVVDTSRRIRSLVKKDELDENTSR